METIFFCPYFWTNQNKFKLQPDQVEKSFENKNTNATYFYKFLCVFVLPWDLKGHLTYKLK